MNTSNDRNRNTRVTESSPAVASRLKSYRAEATGNHGVRIYENLVPNSFNERSRLDVPDPRVERSLASGQEIQKKTGRYQGKYKELRLATLNVGSMTGKEGELVKELVYRGVKACCMQEVKWTGEGQMKLGENDQFTFYWKGQDVSKGVANAGVGIMLESDIDVIDVNGISERLMIMKIRTGAGILNIFSAYAPQTGLTNETKDIFWNELYEQVRKVPKDEWIWFGGDLNGHIGKNSGGYSAVHGGVGYGDRNADGVRILEFCDTFGLTIGNTWFKRNEKRLITYASGEGKSIIDFIIVRAEDRKLIRNVKVIPGLEIVRQHKLVVCDIKFKVNRVQKVKWQSRTKIWKLKDEKVHVEYEQKLSEIDNLGGDNVNGKWSIMKETLLKTAEEVCGKTKGPPRHKETWWWKPELDDIVEKKKKCYKDWFKADKKNQEKRDELKELYMVANRKCKRAVEAAKRTKRREFANKLNTAEGMQNVFKIAKQMVKDSKISLGGSCLKDENGKVVTGDENLKKLWKKFMEKLLNEENEWDGKVEADKVEGPQLEISQEEVKNVMKKMKYGKAGGPTGVVADMFKAGGETVVKWITNLCNSIVTEGKIPDDWTKSTMATLYKGKGDPMKCGSYRGIKLLEHGLKIFDGIIDVRIRKIVKIDESQFGFIPGRGTMDAVFVVRQLQEKMLGKTRRLYLAFVDLEKAFDRVPREVVKWALRKEGVPEWLVAMVMSTYSKATTAVRVGQGLSEEFEVKVGVHQGSKLSPLLFVIVMQAVTKHVASGLPWELLYADDLVIMAESEDELRTKLIEWKSEMEKKGLRVNMGKTKVMCSEYGKGKVNKGAKFPCGVCGNGVSNNAMECSKCKQWVHKKCIKSKKSVSTLIRELRERGENFICSKCKFEEEVGSGFVNGKEMVLNGEEKCEVVDKFCYLGDMLSVGGGADAAVVTRVSSGWKKFRELEPILTDKDVTSKIKGDLYTACVRSVMIYGAETWPMTQVLAKKLDCVEMRMVRWMCGVSLKDHFRSEDLRKRLGIINIEEVVRRARLRWFGHVRRKDDEHWVKKCMDLAVEGTTLKGNRKTWRKTVDEDMKLKGLKEEDCVNRPRWRRGLKVGLQGSEVENLTEVPRRAGLRRRT